MNHIFKRIEIAIISLLVVIFTINFIPHLYPTPDYRSLVMDVGNVVVNVGTYESAKQPDNLKKTEIDQLKKFGIPLPDFQEQEDDEAVLEQRGVGSGFIISATGYVLTNAHVVKDAEVIKVKMHDGTEYVAKLIGIDERTDVAVIKIDTVNINTARLGNSDRVQSGDWVMAIGSPHGLEKTVTAGIVSSTNREIGEFMQFIQTDVAINPGNSGGPLFNKYGEVIGINSMILSKTGAYAGIALAIPINDALTISKQLIKHGKIDRGRLGISATPLMTAQAKKLRYDKDYGVLTAEVQPSGPGDIAGIHTNDIILEVNGIKIYKPIELIRIVTNSTPGSTIKLLIWRNGVELEITPTLDKMAEVEVDKKKK